MGKPNDVTLADLRQLHPAGAVGLVRRSRDGVVEDVAAFAYREPARWRVRHLSGQEIVVRGEQWWTRGSGDVGGWSHGITDPGTEVHHNGYLQAMLFPARLPAISDAASVVTSREALANGDRRLVIAYRDPVEGTMSADVSPDGHLVRLEGEEDGVVVLELRVDSWEPPREDLFDPDVEWESPVDG